MISWKEHIITNPKILSGKPVIKGTRIPVDLILEKLATGDSYKDILTAYPTININDIYACLLFAARTVKNENIYPLV